MASMFTTLLGSVFGGPGPSKEVAALIGKIEGEEIIQSLNGIPYSVDGSNILVGNKELDVSPYIEQCAANESDHVCGVRFEISTKGQRQSALTMGFVGNGPTKDAALKDAVHSWWAEFAVPLIASMAERTPNFEKSSIRVYKGALSIRGTPPGGWIDGSSEMHGKITSALKPLVRDNPPTKVISLRLMVTPDGVTDLGSRIDGSLSRELLNAVAPLPWPKTQNRYVFYQIYVFRHKSEE